MIQTLMISYLVAWALCFAFSIAIVVQAGNWHKIKSDPFLAVVLLGGSSFFWWALIIAAVWALCEWLKDELLERYGI